jgi:alkaline phosphatase
MRRIICVLISIFFSLNGQAKEGVPIGQSHNDYRQKRPLATALEAGMKLIEADVFFKKGSLCVGHTVFHLHHSHNLHDLYLQPLVEAVRSGKIYPLKLVIDVKSEPIATLNEIVRQLNVYPDVFNDQSPIKIVISGKRPRPCDWDKYPNFIFFDGRPNELYSDAQWQRVGMMSANFKHYTRFLVGNYKTRKLKTTIQTAHDKGKIVRFWKTHDKERTWERLTKLGVDVINTDKPLRLKLFLDKKAHQTTFQH